MSEEELRRQVIDVRARNETLLAVLRLAVVLIKVCELSLRHRCVPEGEKKRLLIRAVDRSKVVLSLRKVLLVIGLSKTRSTSGNARRSVNSTTSRPVLVAGHDSICLPKLA